MHHVWHLLLPANRPDAGVRGAHADSYTAAQSGLCVALRRIRASRTLEGSGKLWPLASPRDSLTNPWRRNRFSDAFVAPAFRRALLLQADAHLKASATEPRRRIVIVTTLRVPKTGGIPTTQVIVVKWLKRKGQTVRLREPLVELQTEKVNYELESPAEGVLLEIVAKEDSEVPVGEPLCHIGQPGEAVPKS
jgi:hypothetical protein